LKTTNFILYNNTIKFKFFKIEKKKNGDSNEIIKVNIEVIKEFNVVPNYQVIIEDLFDISYSCDLLGPRMFLIIFNLVNAKTMNLETGLESFFASFQNQSFSGGQKPETLVHRGVIKNHIRDGFSQMKTNMEQLASICKNGLPAFNIDKILLPITFHHENSTPAAFMKNYFQKNNDMYNRSATDRTFIEKCKAFTN